MVFQFLSQKEGFLASHIFESSQLILFWWLHKLSDTVLDKNIFERPIYITNFLKIHILFMKHLLLDDVNYWKLQNINDAAKI